MTTPLRPLLCLQIRITRVAYYFVIRLDEAVGAPIPWIRGWESSLVALSSKEDVDQVLVTLC